MITILIALTVFSFLIVSSSILYVQALPKDPNWGKIDSVCTSDGDRMTCCWEDGYDDGSGHIDFKTYCQTCVGTSNDDCGVVYDPNDTRAPTGNEVSPGLPPTEGISDDPKSGNDINPSTPPTEGVEDDTSNNNENGNTEGSSNSIPNKGGIFNSPNIREGLTQ